jgi:integrase
MMIQTHFVLFYNSGVRPEESYRLKWDQLDLEEPLIDVKKGQTKIKKQRSLALNKEAHPQLLKWREYQSQYLKNAEHIFTRIDGRLMTNSDYRAPFDHACLKCGYAKKVERLTQSGKMRTYVDNTLMYYDSRRSFRTFKLKDVNPADGKAAMGHTQDTTYGDYLNKKEAAMRVVEAMDGKALEPMVAPVIDKRSRLIELKSLFDDGLIDEMDYREEKGKVLSL